MVGLAIGIATGIEVGIAAGLTAGLTVGLTVGLTLELAGGFAGRLWHSASAWTRYYISVVKTPPVDAARCGSARSWTGLSRPGSCAFLVSPTSSGTVSSKTGSVHTPP